METNLPIYDTGAALLIRGADVLTPWVRLPQTDVLISGGKIVALGAEASANQAAESLDAAGLLLAPGLVELQINGAFGIDFSSQPERLWEAAAGLARWGITSFLPTLITSPREQLPRLLDSLHAGPPPGYAGPRPLGLHVEGPFLNPERKGAHPPQHLRLPDVHEFASCSVENGVRLVTLAPELPGAPELIASLIARGVVVSAGHSMASIDQAQAAFAGGVRYATHLFNAMSPLLQSNPGLPGAVLGEPGWRFGLICDGIHVHPTLVALIWKLSGPQRLTLVTDAIAALGMPPGVYALGDNAEVHVDERTARLASGVLAGSVLTPNDALRNLMRFTGCSLGEALACFTCTPAELLGLQGEIGSIAPGQRADLVLFDEQLNVQRVYVDGQPAYSS